MANKRIVIIFILVIIFLYTICHFIRTTMPANHQPCHNKRARINHVARKATRIKKTKQIESRPIMSLLDILHLAKYYHVGVDDIYLPDGTKVPGVQPDGTKALKYYKMAVDRGYTRAVYDIGMIYEHGCGRLAGDKQRAKDFYKNIISMRGLDADVRMTAIEKLDKLSNNNNNNDHYHYQQEYNDEAIILNDAPEPPLIIIDNAPQFVRNNNNNPYTDAQNTHDSLLNKTAKASLDRISNNQPVANTNDHAMTLKEIREFIGTYANKDKQQDALRVLDTMSAHNQYITNFNKNELDILYSVWNRIKNNINPEYVNNTKETLVDYLADSVEHGVVTCATGRANRVMNALNIVDPEVSLKNSSLINEEILNKSSAIRNKMYDALTPEKKESVDSDGKDAIEFTNQLKTAIKDMVKEDYINTKIISQDESEQMIEKWIDHI